MTTSSRRCSPDEQPRKKGRRNWREMLGVGANSEGGEMGKGDEAGCLECCGKRGARRLGDRAGEGDGGAAGALGKVGP